MAESSRYKNDRDFEAAVRGAAEALFLVPPGECQSQTYTKPNKQVEIDGVVEDRGVVHLIMVTRSPRLAKVHEDVGKLGFAQDVEEGKGNTVKKWMIVELPPEGPHGEFAKKNNVTLLTFDQFRRRFFDGTDYLAKRAPAPFGSARDPRTNLHQLLDDEYIEPPIENLETRRMATFQDLVDDVRDGRVAVVLGPFGSGKSLTVREVWKELRRQHTKKKDFEAVPVALNLREHWGALHADEMLRRHARSLGLARDEDLVMAWRVGLLAFLVDGFDEVAAQGVSALDRDVLKRVRFDALAAVRGLFTNASSPIGAVIAGRDHYFDDRKELVHALGLNSSQVVRYRIHEFDAPRTAKYLQRQGVTTPLPQWLPRRALLLGYLVHRGLLQEVVGIDGAGGEGAAWKAFLSLICEREAQHERAVMDPETIQRVLEELAIGVRATPTGTGPITARDLSGAYTEVTGEPPGDAVLMQLQRLTGLTERDQEPGSRAFIDLELLAALQGWGVARLLMAAQGSGRERSRSRSALPRAAKWYGPLPVLSQTVARLVLEDNGWTLDALVRRLRDMDSNQFQADVLGVCVSWAVASTADLNLKMVKLTGVHLGAIDLEEVQIRGLHLCDSVIDELVVGARAHESEITLSNSLVSELSGAGSIDGLPSTIILDQGCEISKFDVLNTTAAIVRLPVDDRVRALLTVLKKLFRQRGAGRVVGAFRRGIPANISAHIDSALALVVKQGLAWVSADVYHPVWSEARRAFAILDSQASCDDPLIEMSKAI